MQLRGISDHRRVTGEQLPFEAYPGWKRGGEQFQSFLGDRLHMNRRTLTESTATETEDAVNQRFGAAGSMQDVIQVAPQRAALHRLLMRKFAVAEDRTEDVVEVVGDPAGESAYRFHLLRLPQLCLEVLLVDLRLLLSSDVDCRAGKPVRIAARIAQAAP